MPRLIIHTATRIVRRLTIDPDHKPELDETEVVVPDGFDIGNGPWKLADDNITLVRPTQAELDQESPLPKTVYDAIISALNKTEVHPGITLPVKDFIAAFRSYLILLCSARNDVNEPKE